MKIILFGIAVAYCLLHFCYGAVPQLRNVGSLADPDVFIPYQGERFSIFDWDLCKLMSTKYSGNILLSPLSLKLALVLLFEGAQEQTAHELAGVLHLPQGRWAARDQFSLILRSLRPISREYQLNLGTRIYLDNSVSLKQSYAAVVKTFYSTDVVPSNFSDASSVTHGINSWVNNVTNGHIEKMIDDENNVKHSVMLIMNVLFFKGTWLHNYFPKNQTRMAKFHKNSMESIDVPFMTAVGQFYYVESTELDAKILRIPYVGRKIAMYIVLPRTQDGLVNLMKDINSYILTRHVWAMQKLPVEVKLPKFKIDFTSYLEPVLRELGIKDIFENTATLTGIARAKKGSAQLMVTEIVQKAGIEVNEEGTTAYVATEIELGNKVADQEFTADHPFLFYLEDEITGTILYMGRIVNPLETTGNTEASGVQLPIRQDDFVPQPAAAPMGNSNFRRYDYFNVELLQAVSEATINNIIISPLSVKSALTILSEGTAGKTRDELLAILRLPLDPAQIRTISGYTLSPLQDKQIGAEISLANRLWVGRDTRITGDFNNLLKRYYGGDTLAIDFADTTRASGVINDWVRQVTKNNIQSLVDGGSISPGTQLLLTSAIYFKGQWLKSFDPTATRSRCFNVPNTGCQQVEMMENVSKYRYANVPNLDAQVVEIPYADGRLSMVMMLPNREGLHSLQTLFRDLSYSPLASTLASLRETELLLQIPKFSIESKLNLRPTLEALGIKDIFGFDANLSGILAGKSAQIGSVLHDAKIEVNEQGTVAAAVTGISVIPLMGSTMDTFRADRPFLFAIVDQSTGSMIFAGRVVQPTWAASPSLG